MTHAQMLAASPRALTEVLIDRLRRQTDPLAQLRSSNAERGNENAQFDLRLDDPADDTHADPAPNALRPDEVAAAVLLGITFEKQRDILARLQDADAVTIIEVPGEEYIAVIDRILRRHVLGPAANVVDGDSLGSSAHPAATGTVAVFVRRDDPKRKGSAPVAAQPTLAEFATAVRRNCAIIAITTEPDRLLPREIVRLADTTIVIPRLDGEAIAQVIAAVTGRHPGALDERLAASVTFDALNLAVRGDLGAERSLARLTSLLGSKVANAEPAGSSL